MWGSSPKQGAAKAWPRSGECLTTCIKIKTDYYVIWSFRCIVFQTFRVHYTLISGFSLKFQISSGFEHRNGIFGYHNLKSFPKHENNPFQNTKIVLQIAGKNCGDQGWYFISSQLFILNFLTFWTFIYEFLFTELHNMSIKKKLFLIHESILSPSKKIILILPHVNHN